MTLLCGHDVCLDIGGGCHLAATERIFTSWAGTKMTDVFDEARNERARAHAKHGDTSMESSPPDTYRRLAILMEELGEVAKEFNDAEHDGRPVDLAKLRTELIHVAAMAGAWADACGKETAR